MKTLVIAALFAVVTTVAYAQQPEVKRETYPIWTISKDVQKVQFKNIEYTPAEVQTGDTGLALSKGVQRINRDGAENTGKVKTGGTPSWVVSKGVARMNYERNK